MGGLGWVAVGGWMNRHIDNDHQFIGNISVTIWVSSG